MKYKVVLAKRFRREFKRAYRRGKKLKKVWLVIDTIAAGEPLDPVYKDHALSDSREFKGCRECHVEPDWLLVYRIDNGNLTLLVMATGTHSDLFSILL